MVREVWIGWKTIYSLFCCKNNLHTLFCCKNDLHTFFVTKIIYVPFFCRKNNLCTLSGKFLRVEVCRLESFDSWVSGPLIEIKMSSGGLIQIISKWGSMKAKTLPTGYLLLPPQPALVWNYLKGAHAAHFDFYQELLFGTPCIREVIKMKLVFFRT